MSFRVRLKFTGLGAAVFSGDPGNVTEVKLCALERVSHPPYFVFPMAAIAEIDSTTRAELLTVTGLGSHVRLPISGSWQTEVTGASIPNFTLLREVNDLFRAKIHLKMLAAKSDLSSFPSISLSDGGEIGAEDYVKVRRADGQLVQGQYSFDDECSRTRPLFEYLTWTRSGVDLLEISRSDGRYIRLRVADDADLEVMLEASPSGAQFGRPPHHYKAYRNLAQDPNYEVPDLYLHINGDCEAVGAHHHEEDTATILTSSGGCPPSTWP